LKRWGWVRCGRKHDNEYCTEASFSMPALKYFIGTRFGRLVITSRQGTRISCQCDCGKAIIVSLTNLCNGHNRSCGCLRVETTTARSTKHGDARRHKKTITYQTWCGMWKRCTNPQSEDWPNYGGRGITVCERWQTFEYFLADMGEKPRGLSIERDDVNGSYCQSNCRWATRKEQNRNTRKTRWLSDGARTQSLAAWAEELGLSHTSILYRLRRGWPMARVLGK
jgi:hypothetical protein